MGFARGPAEGPLGSEFTPIPAIHMQPLTHPRSSAAGAVLLTLLLSTPAQAQVSHGGQPEGLLLGLPEPARVVMVAPPDVETYRVEDVIRRHKPLRYGAMVETYLSLDDGEWTHLADGSRIWRMRVVSPGAKSLALEFELFGLPHGARMYVYNPLVETILGSYTRDNHHEDRSFVFEPFPGEDLTLEIDLPAGVADPLIYTRALIYDYRDVFGLMDGTVKVHTDEDDRIFVGACLIDVNCPEGDPWELQKRATVRTLSGGSLCSGALINNTANDGTQYVLTAHHCGQTASTVFRFRYQRSGCGSGTAPTTNNVSGATVLATNSTFDNRLLRITGAIPGTYQPYFAGWTRSTANTNYAFAMGHPSGGPKKISIDDNGTNRETTFWRVTWSDGTLEGGSSGGPLFDSNGRVRGPACCVNGFTCTGQTAWFGRFDQFYSSNSLAQWLDPLGTNPTTIDGYDPDAGPPCSDDVITYCETSPNSAGAGAIINWTGQTSIDANNFTLLAHGLPTNTFGIFFYGSNATWANFGNGLLCVSGSTFRLPLLQSGFTGVIAHDVDFTEPPAGSGPGLITSGSQWHFQAWYRDTPGGGAGFNLSDALRVIFCP